METQQNIEQGSPNIHSEHVKEEFYKWFESRGLLSELRAYMRQLMLKALEESNKNGKTARQRKASTSPKLQAINLLVIDYLFHEDYLFTVSVFASEAQILENLPQYSRYITETIRERRWDPSSLPRFSQQETEDILDTLRLPPARGEAHQAARLYLSGHESLLTCVVRTLSSAHNHCEEYVRSDVPDVEERELCSHQLWSQEMQDLLLLAGVKLQHIRRMQHKWDLMIEEERFQAKKEAEEEQRVQQEAWEQLTEQRLRMELAGEIEAEQQLLREQQSEVEMKEKHLVGLAQQLSTVHSDVTEKLSQLQLQRLELQQRENHQESEKVLLQEKFSQLQLREEQLDQASASSQRPAETGCEHQLFETESKEARVITREASVQAVSEGSGLAVYTQTLEPVETVFTQTIDNVDHEQQTSLSQPDPQILHQLQIEREKINELQEENLELRAHALQQRQRIDELTNRAASLSSQLEESQLAVAVLSGRESALVPAPPPPPTTPTAQTFVVPTFGYNTPQRIGAGEESLFTPRTQQAAPRPDGRRRPLRFAFSQSPTHNSEESSPTDEMIQNARARISQLEEESAVLQRNYQEFQTRLLTSDSVMFPPLNPSRVHDPVMRVRRSSFVPFPPVNQVPYPSLPPSNQRSRSRQTHGPYEDNEDSSSDRAGYYDTDGIENLKRSRRLFTHRHIRQFERWKQFKKKFQKRDICNRRYVNALSSNTSSDDEDRESRNVRRFESNKHKRNHEDQHTSDQIQNTCQFYKKEQNKSDKNENKVEMILPRCKNKPDIVSKNFLLTRNSSVMIVPEEGSCSKENSKSLNVDKKLIDELKQKSVTQLKLEMEESVKLIESVKILLGAQQATSTLSNGSLAVESLPRDSQNDSQNEIAHTENSSVLTVQTVNPTGHKEVDQKTHDNIVETIINPKINTEKTSSVKNYSKADSTDLASALSKIDLTDDLDEEGALDLAESHPSPLTVPALRLVSPAQNVASEDFMATAAITSTDLGERVSGDLVTASVTSGSDILRDLNPSKTESSDSVMSTGWAADDSKHSSDFWN